MDFRILGPLEALDQGRAVALGGSKQRALLALLLLNANETLSTERLIDELWGEDPPATAAKTVQVHISRLRKALAGDAGAPNELIVTHEHGYRLELEPARVDARRFEGLLADGRAELAADRPKHARSLLEEALALWRGPPLGELEFEPFAQAEIGRMQELRVSALEALIEAKLATGRHAEVIGPLQALIAEHPYREGLRAQLMLALYRSERQADALQAYQETRIALVGELGIEPGRRLRDLEAAILAHDPSLLAPVAPAAPAPPPAEAADPATPPEPDAPRPAARRLVSIVFVDLVGSTSLAERLDPESMHRLLDRYTAACGAVIEKHGGTVEGFIGDSVVGVFGLPELHEDDGLRAVRAALELRAEGEALSSELGVKIAMKLGVESGRVFVSPGARRSPFAAGDAFNVASRLEGAAAEGEILLGENVHELVGDSVRAEPLGGLTLKGRAEEVTVWRLVDLADPAPLGPRGTPFVGRSRELDVLRDAFDQVCSRGACQPVTVVGPAGIGKSRLAKELTEEIGERAGVVVGRCLSYGEAATDGALGEMVRQLAGDDPRQGLSDLLEGDDRVARLVLSAIGEGDAPVQEPETPWAIRRLFEQAARERPLVLFVDDVQWAETHLLELLEYLVAFSSGHPILLVCLARPEFLDTRPAWAGPRADRPIVALEPLTEAESRRLVEGVGTDGLDAHRAGEIVARAEGNPLFLEQLVAVGSERGRSELPASIQAVLVARLEQLEPRQRALLETASVQGRSFYVGAVEDLLPEPERAGLTGELVTLVQKQLIRGDRLELADRDAFRFAHTLIREAAYESLPKHRRAELHQRVAGWFESQPGARDETVGHHLAEAHRNLSELGVAGERERALAEAAAQRLGVAAGAALRRGDPRAGARLLERAQALLEADDPERVTLLPRLGAALLEAGRLADAERVLSQAIELGDDDPGLRARAVVERQLVRLQAGAGAPEEGAGEIAVSALAVLEAHEDELGQCRALCLRARQHLVEGEVGRADESWQRATGHARSAGDEVALFEILDWRASAALFGPKPVPTALALCYEIQELVSASPVAVARASRPLAALHAMAGEGAEARRLVLAGDRVLAELGGLDSAVTQQEALVDLLAGRPAAAEARLRLGFERLEAMGEKALLATTASMLAHALHCQGRPEEAAFFCRASEEAAARDDLSAQVGWRSARARLLADEGCHEGALALATEAVRLAEPTDFLTLHADALLDLGAVRRQAGQTLEADTAARAAHDLYRRKGDLVSAERARSALGGDHYTPKAHQRWEEDNGQVRQPHP